MPDFSAPITAISDRDAALALFNALQERASAAGITLREPVGCCGRGCNGCVWEGYYSAVNYWRDEALLALQD
jgi:hypothetical protein